MLVLRCTLRLLDRLGLFGGFSGSASTGRLGDWYANSIYLHSRQAFVVLALSERTLLPVLLPVTSARALPARLTDAVSVALGKLGVERPAIEREQEAMSRASFARAGNRRVIGSLNQFALRAIPHLDAGHSLSATATALADSPCSLLDLDTPRRATIAAFPRT